MSARAAGQAGQAQRPAAGRLRRGRDQARAWLAGAPPGADKKPGADNQPGADKKPGADQPGAVTEAAWLAAADGPEATRTRQLVVLVFVGSFILSPAVAALTGPGRPAERWFLFCGSLAFLAAAAWVVVGLGRHVSRQVPWGQLSLLMALAIALNAIGGLNYLAAVAVAAAGFGRFAATARPAQAGAVIGMAGGLLTAVLHQVGYGGALAALGIPPMAAYFAYSASKRNEMVAALRRNRAELAQLAVARERLRIARDLHDLLGHSLSLITLKAELAGRLIQADPGRAAREIGELESVARQSLTDVRQAVVSYRRPDLATELAAARELLTTAGIGCQITAPARLELAPGADALLAWTVREGVTNVVRHSGAGHAVITVTAGPDWCTAEIADDGPGPGAPATVPGADAGAAGVPRRTGSGLAGLAERARELGGVLTAGPAVPHGFTLAVSIPAAPGTAP